MKTLCKMFFFALIFVTFNQIVFTQNVDMEKVASLYEQANQLYQDGNYKESATIYREGYELGKETKYASVMAYNSACSYALSGNAENAIKMANEAYEAGMLVFESDSDFDSIRENEEFVALCKKANAEMEELEKAYKDPLVVLPADFDEMNSSKHLLIFAIHGYGGTPPQFAEIYKDVAEKQNAIVVCSRATEVISRTGYGWTFEEEELERLKKELAFVAEKYKIPAEQTILTGFSQGGYLTYLLGGENSDLFAGLIPVAGNFPEDFEPKITNKNLKIFSIVGEKDSEKNRIGNKKANAYFNENGTKMKLNFFDMGHTYPENSFEVLMEGIQFVLDK